MQEKGERDSINSFCRLCVGTRGSVSKHVNWSSEKRREKNIRNGASIQRENNRNRTHLDLLR